MLRLAKAKREPKDLAQEFQQTLADNDAEDMMMLSILGHGLNNWKVIAQARNARALENYEAELADAEKKPREERSEKEQARYFTLHSLIGKIKQSNTDEFWQAQEAELPNLRRQFMEQQYLQFVLALTEAGLNPEAAKLGKINTSRITDNYLQAGLNGGTVILHHIANMLSAHGALKGVYIGGNKGRESRVFPGDVAVPSIKSNQLVDDPGINVAKSLTLLGFGQPRRKRVYRKLAVNLRREEIDDHSLGYVGRLHLDQQFIKRAHTISLMHVGLFAILPDLVPCFLGVPLLNRTVQVNVGVYPDKVCHERKWPLGKKS